MSTDHAWDSNGFCQIHGGHCSMAPAVDPRTEYIAGLRELADILYANPDLPLPYHGDLAQLLWIPGLVDDQKEQAAAFTRAIPGKVDKQPRGDAFDLVGKIRGLAVCMILDRDQVCERVVVGTETVTVPATEAVEAQPERVEEREIVRWECMPILRDTDDTDDASEEAVA